MASKGNSQSGGKSGKTAANDRGAGSRQGAQNTGGRVRANEGRKSGGTTTTGGTGPRKKP